MSRRPYKRFTEEELNYLRENGPKMKPKEIAEKLNRSCDSITIKLNKLGIVWPRDKNNAGRPANSHEKWHGCDKTCPDFCPYSDCLMPLSEAAVGIEKDFKITELFYGQGAKS